MVDVSPHFKPAHQKLAEIRGHIPKGKAGRGGGHARRFGDFLPARGKFLHLDSANSGANWSQLFYIYKARPPKFRLNC